MVGTLRTKDILVWLSVLLNLTRRIAGSLFVGLFILANLYRIGGIHFCFPIHRRYTMVTVGIVALLGVVAIWHTLDS